MFPKKNLRRDRPEQGSALPSYRTIGCFFALCYLAALILTVPYLNSAPSPDLRTAIFTLLSYLTYAGIYLAPALGVSLLSRFLFNRSFVPGSRGFKNGVVAWVCILAAGATCLLIYVDTELFKIYGWHLNGFVVNLLLTPGGIDSLGASSSSQLVFALISVGLLLCTLVGFKLTRKFTERPGQATSRSRKVLIMLACLFLLASLTERGIYAVSELQGHTPVLMASNAFPFYKTTTIHSLARKLGMKITKRPNLKITANPQEINYPLAPLRVEPPTRPLNIIWLVAESWRADMLTPEIMPQTWAFANTAQRFNHHYSGGNGTRMALFSMFYGLYGTYWFDFLGMQRSPLIIDLLQQQDYAFGLFTSQSFTYPELNKTVFTNFPTDQLHEDGEGFGWQRDQRNTTRLIDFLSADHQQPFMAFMFFESPHARYYFPPESVIRRPYLENFNYATTDLEGNIEQILNRYINACHHLDGQLGRVFETLQEQGLLDNSIVIVTGDHGEEFMEKGRWGHNSTFSEEQTRVPLALWIPGGDHREVNRITSHLDLVPTLLPHLGVKNPASDYSQGEDLINGPERTSAVITDWNYLGLIGPESKFYIPFRSGAEQAKLTDMADSTLDQTATNQFFISDSQRIEALLKNAHLFTQPPKK